jgi:hypothetical protein
MENVNTLYLPKEKKYVNPLFFQVLDTESILNDIPTEEISKPDFVRQYGKLTKLSKQNPVDNMNWDYIKFLDSNIFRPAAIAFETSKKENAGSKMSGRYCHYIKGTKQYNEFWEEEIRRCMKGYEPIIDGVPCGLAITGEFYFYLNYTLMDTVKRDKNGDEVVVTGFPNFLAQDYYYFKEIDARENPKKYKLPNDYKKSITIAKSRRKGFSFKAGAGALWLAIFRDRAKVLIASATGHDATLCFKKAMVSYDWVTLHTPFGRPALSEGWKQIPISLTNDEGHFIAGIENTRTKERRGRLSEIATVSLNKADSISGEGVQRIYFEESGKCPNLGKSWTFAKESLKAGSFQKGIAIIFGTGGDMVKEGGTKGNSNDFANLFNKPDKDLAMFKNIYEYEDRGDEKCGWFVSDMWSNFGAEIMIGDTVYPAIDSNGNANFWVAELYLNAERISERLTQGKAKYELFLTQRCKTPSEAFFVPQGSVFPSGDLMEVKAAIEASRGSFEALRQPGELIEFNGTVMFKPDLEGKLKPVEEYTPAHDREGCLLRYMPPHLVKGKVPEGLYIISVDPIGKNTSGGKSLSSIIVMQTPKYFHNFGRERVVATYRGRSADRPQEYVQELLLRLSKYYNAMISYENDQDGGIYQYFLRKGELKRLMSRPAMTMDKYLPNSLTKLREYGHSMASDRHKQIGEDLTRDWLLKYQPDKNYMSSDGTVVKEKGKRNLDYLQDRALIEELIQYKRGGNYDVAMAFMGIIIQLNEHYNEDFLTEARHAADSVTDFTRGLYYNIYGSDAQRYKHSLKQTNKDIESIRDLPIVNDYYEE